MPRSDLDDLYNALCEGSCDWNATPVVSVDEAHAYARKYAALRLREAEANAAMCAEAAGEKALNPPNEIVKYSMEERRSAYRRMQRFIRAMADEEESNE